MKVKAISLWEPWASLMRCGAKTIETRSWATSYRGPLLICAANRPLRHAERMLLLSPPFDSALSALRVNVGEPFDRCLSFGHAVCLVDMKDCWPTHVLLGTQQSFVDVDRELPFGDYSRGRFAWITSNLRTFDPFPVRGAQGLFEVELPEELESLVIGTGGGYT